MNTKAKILVVDDDRTVAETLAALLRLHGFEVKFAFSGKSAIQVASTFEPQALITDVMMPGLNGVETASQIRALFPKCKVLLISGRSAAADLVLKMHVLDEGFELLSKPVHPHDLLMRL
jgi:DNA-binding response OmpR family regulator